MIEDGETQASAGQGVVRAIVGGGFGRMNPVLVTVRLSSVGSERTAVVVRGAAEEGLVKQRAGEKTAKRLAQVLAPPDLVSPAFGGAYQVWRGDPTSRSGLSGKHQLGKFKESHQR